MTAADPHADLPSHAIDAATKHLHDVLTIALEHGPGERALVVYDTRTGLSRALLEGYRQRDGLQWSDARLGLVDLQWADIRPEKGLYHRLLARGRMQRIVEDEAIVRAVTEPPSDTRAFFRGRCVSRFGADLVGASWDSVIFDLPGRGKLQRVPTREPLRGTEALTAGLFARHREAAPFLAELLGLPPGS